MNKKIKILISIFFVVAVLISSCKSKPETVPEVKQEPEKVEVVKPKPETNEQKKVKKTEQPKKEKSATEIQKERLLAEIDKLKKGAVKAAREQAERLEANSVYPDKFADAAKTETDADKAAKSGKLKDAISKYKDAIYRYDTLSNLMKAGQLRSEIEEFGFAPLLPNDYSSAEKLSMLALENYDNNCKLAKENSEGAVKLYKKVVAKGYREFSEKAKASAKANKADCDSIKVARSRTDDYNNAVRTFNEGKSNERNADFKASFLKYTDSAKMFSTLYSEVSVKREAATAAMKEAARKQQESSQLALEADQEAPLKEGETIEGFTDVEIGLEDKSSAQSTKKVEDIVSDEEDNVKKTNSPNNLPNKKDSTSKSVKGEK